MRHVLALFLVLALTPFTAAWGEEAPPEPLDVSTARVIVFKDGYCLFVKEAKGRADAAGNAVIERVPESMVLGSFWALPKKGALKNVTASQQIAPGRPGRRPRSASSSRSTPPPPARRWRSQSSTWGRGFGGSPPTGSG